MKTQPLDFEKPIIELEEKLADLKTHSREHDVDFENEVRRMELKIVEINNAQRCAVLVAEDIAQQAVLILLKDRRPPDVQPGAWLAGRAALATA